MSNTVVFQTDSEIVTKVYNGNPNYLVDGESSIKSNDNYCVLYFSSNDIYYPNTSEAFEKQLVLKDRYEWYGLRVKAAQKHIFVRDIKKQWYLSGINREVDTIEKLHALLKKETEGYKLITLGSSAGGYAAVLFGSLLNAERILTFNGQFYVNDLLKTTSEAINPILFREIDNPKINKYYSIRNYIQKPERIYYFYSNRSEWDLSQYEHIKDLGIQCIPFQTSHHGIPFLKSNLKYVLNLKESNLLKLVGKLQYPLLFSFKIEGFFHTFLSLFQQTKKMLIRKYFNKI